MQTSDNLLAISLFTGAGIGDIGFKASGFSFVAMSEYEHDRAELAKSNFPEACMFTGDINLQVDKIVDYIDKEFLKRKKEIFLISCTAPCQGMSKSGQGTLLNNIRKGIRPKLDPRNRLILPSLSIIKQIKPRFVVFENVCEMRNTIIEDDDARLRPILDIIHSNLQDEYIGQAYDVEFADYGIPQRRKRLITIYTRDKLAITYYEQGVELVPETTHSRTPHSGKLPWISVKEALHGFPSLDAKDPDLATHPKIPFHRVPVLDPKKYEWIKHTPPGASAFDNQCINPKCLYQGNKTHKSKKNHKGINQAAKDTPLYCERCGEILPRPYVEGKDGKLRIMSGYTSAYKRMDPDLPCPALTRNFSFPCSDHKVHPFENRVLSIAEAFVIQTISELEYKWGPITNGREKALEQAPDTLIRLVVGESIPPKFTKLLGDHIIKLSRKNSTFTRKARQTKFFVTSES